MIKAALSIGTAALIAGLVCALPAPGVQAGTGQREAISAAPAPAVHPASAIPAASAAPAALAAPVALGAPAAERSDARPRGAACSQHAWPYYDTDCLVGRDGRAQGAPRQVRLVAIDRRN